LKVARSVGIINRVKSILCCDLLKTLYYLLIHPYLHYCNIVWDNATKLALNRLICLQKRAMRLLTNSYYRASSKLLFHRLGILKVNDIHRLQIGLFMFKAKNKLLPSSCSHHISAATINHTYSLRVQNTFEMISFRTELRRKYIGVSGPILWQSLPELTRESLSLHNFKTLMINASVASYGQLRIN